MKYILYILNILIFFQPLSSADEIFIEVEDQPVFSQSVQSKLRNIEQNLNPVNINIIKFNKYANLEKATITLFPSEKFYVLRKFSENSKAYKYSLKNHRNGSAIFIKNGNRFRGILHTEKDKYEVFPLENGYHAAIKLPLDFMKIPSCTHDLPEAPPVKQKDKKVHTINNECFIRVMVAYTENARSDRGGYQSIQEDIELAIELTNDSYENSDVNQVVKLVRTLEVSYDETSSSYTDLQRLTNDGDGYMDNIHTVRDIYSADLIVLVEDMPDYCGIAWLNVSDADHAFSIVSSYSTCLTYYYSFAHEMGHNMGCRHNPEEDPNDTPYPYGHGYCNTDDNWRTIMSYNTGCISRLRYWSNPDVYYNGDPMGTSDEEDNARVLDNTESRSMNYLTTPTNYTIGNDELDGYEFGDILVRENAETGTSYVAENNSTVTIRAGSSIKLKPGFHAMPGSSFKSYIETDCPTQPAEQPLAFSEDQNLKEDKQILKNIPNPFSENTLITFYLEKPGRVTLILSNSIGKKNYILSNKYFVSGKHSINFQRKDLASGIYFYMLKTHDKCISNKMIIY